MDPGVRRTDLPTGTVTFVFTDPKGSPVLLRAVGTRVYSELLSDHRYPAPPFRGRHS